MSKEFDGLIENKIYESPVDKYINIEDLYKSYGDNVILDNIDLNVKQGSFVTVVGPSGCGKSTLLRLILGQEFPTTGKLHVDNVKVGHPSEGRGIVYQKYSLYPNKTVLENVLFGMTIGKNKSNWKKNKEKIKEEAFLFLEKAGLAVHSGKYPHELSGGMQQRVAVLQALIMKPKILLMDEPFGALDPGTREDLQIFLIEMQREYNITIFFVTHDLEEAVFLGDRIIVLSQYYKDDRGYSYRDKEHGAKIVIDENVTSFSGIDDKLKSEFTAMIETIRHEGFNQHHLQDIRDFSLNHEQSFRRFLGSEVTKKD